MRKAVLNKLFYPLGGVALFLLAWLIAAKALDVELVLPTPGQAAGRLFKLLATGGFWTASASTLLRTLVSFAVSLALALAAALAGTLLPPLARALSPIVIVLRATPTMSVILLALIWLSPSSAPLLIAFLVIFPMLYAELSAAFAATDPDLIQLSKAYGVRKRDMVRKLYLPAMAPALFTAARSGIGLNLKLMVAAEALASTGASMGNMMQMSKLYLDTAELLAWTVAAIVFSWLLELAVQLARRLALRWERAK